MNKTRDVSLELPQEYQSPRFPESIDFIIPGFEKVYPPGRSKTLALKKRDCRIWYNEFIDRILDACGRRFLPVCRMSDGEFLFLLGEQPFDKRLPFWLKLRLRLGRFKHSILLRGGLGAFTQGHYHSGEYSAEEWRKARLELPEAIRKISEKGILAWHLNYEREPFAERYFPVLGEWLTKNNIIVNGDTYYPFYFVYAMLTGTRRRELLTGRRVLVVNGALDETRRKITEGLKREGVAEVYWCSISLRRSLYDTVDMEPFIGKVDLALVGAGIGKANIMLQMEPLNVPCIDAGFIFEVWKDPQNKGVRSFTVCDDD
ncbi:MAG: hypothetical protein PHV82_00310 [Victivallaceae bacterium]|nr:hypothetical protein [Victivallaceae bacterium]